MRREAARLARVFDLSMRASLFTALAVDPGGCGGVGMGMMNQGGPMHGGGGGGDYGGYSNYRNPNYYDNQRSSMVHAHRHHLPCAPSLVFSVRRSCRFLC
jgi:hypothetical protein